MKEETEHEGILPIASALIGSLSVVLSFFTSWALASGAIAVLLGIISLKRIEGRRFEVILGILTGTLTIVVYLLVFWELLPSLDIF